MRFEELGCLGFGAIRQRRRCWALRWLALLGLLLLGASLRTLRGECKARERSKLFAVSGPSL